MKLYTLFGKM